MGAAQVVQEQHGVGAADLVPGAGDADLLDRVVAVAQAGGVDHVDGHALNLDGLADHVARGAGHRRDDGQLGAGQRVQQAAFAGVGLARNDNAQALAQQCPLACALQQLVQ